MVIIDVASNFFYTGPMMADQDPFSAASTSAARSSTGSTASSSSTRSSSATAVLGNDHPIGPGFKYHAADIPQNSYDPDKAKHHLKKSGFAGVKVNYSASDTAYPGAVDYAAVMKETLGPIGIDL